jgi:DNA/RNA-binding domain of Phe-tRNA-synthetase-like protein
VNEGARVDLQLKAGVIAPDVGTEFPGLRLDWITMPARVRPSPSALVRRLKDLSNGYRGASVVTMRTKPIPLAFRSFFRQIGLDPDVSRIPSERAAVARLLHGEFRSVDLVHDACLVALIETGVPVWALDADLVDPGGLGIRATTEADAHAEHFGDLRYLAPGSLVVADRNAVHAVLFEDPAPGHGFGTRCRRVALFSVSVDGVPAIHVEEALWISAELLGGAVGG